MSITPTDKSHTILSESEKSEVRAQLERLLSDAHFSQSKRFPSFLRFVTELTLAGETEGIKERTLGIEIFGRDAEYDTASDPIVRVTAAEIRKRVAQYYQEPAHEDELRITLPSGSYIPQFHWPKGSQDGALPVLALAEHVEHLEAPHETHPVKSRRRLPLLIALASFAVVLLAAGFGLSMDSRLCGSISNAN